MKKYLCCCFVARVKLNKILLPSHECPHVQVYSFKAVGKSNIFLFFSNLDVNSAAAFYEFISIWFLSKYLYLDKFVTARILQPP